MKFFYVLHVYVSSMHLKHHIKIIEHLLDDSGLVEFFSYPHHGQNVRQIF